MTKKYFTFSKFSFFIFLFIFLFSLNVPKAFADRLDCDISASVSGNDVDVYWAAWYYGGGINANIDWGDGRSDGLGYFGDGDVNSGQNNHNYTSPGTYRISIRGWVPGCSTTVSIDEPSTPPEPPLPPQPPVEPPPPPPPPAPPEICLNGYATNYGGYLPCTFPVPAESSNQPGSNTNFGVTGPGSDSGSGGGAVQGSPSIGYPPSSGASGSTVPPSGMVGPGSGSGPAPASIPVTYSLSVIKTSGGTVSSIDGYINCGTTCTKSNYARGANVTLEAIPASTYWKFNGWSGDCSGVGVCSLNMNSSKSVTARFVPRAFIYKEF